MVFAELLGPNLVTKDGTVATESALSGKTAVGLYFSAHWCPPCRGFTPTLAQMYTDTFKGKGMEIVFVSWDKDEGAYKGYHGEMPWLAIPFKSKEVVSALNKKFKVKGIPTFVILGPDGSVITTDGRKAVSTDPQGAKYPWTPPSKAEKVQMVKDALGKDLVAKSSGKYLGLYFSAHWCPPCKRFTPMLADAYKKGLKDKMEIVFVSSDKSQREYDEYFEGMPWEALPYENRSAKAELSDMFGVEGIPTLVVLNPDGTVLTTQGVQLASSDPAGATLPDGWKPQPVMNVNEDPEAINEEKCILALGKGAELTAAVSALAKKYFDKAGGEVSDMPVRFYHCPPGEITEKLRSLLGVADEKLVITDLSDEGSYYICPEPATTPDAVEEFLQMVNDGEARKKSLK